MPRPKGKVLKIAEKTIPGFDPYFVKGEYSTRYKPKEYTEEAMSSFLPTGAQMRAIKRKDLT